MNGSRRRTIVNLSRPRVVCEHAVIADRPLARMRGLLGRSELPAGEGLLLTPAPAIHTAFMRFPIDVVFLDGDLAIVKLDPHLAPWRAAAASGAHSVLELSAGEIERRQLAVGHRLAAREHVVAPDVGRAGPPAGVVVAT